MLTAGRKRGREEKRGRRKRAFKSLKLKDTERYEEEEEEEEKEEEEEEGHQKGGDDEENTRQQASKSDIYPTAMGGL